MTFSALILGTLTSIGMFTSNQFPVTNEYFVLHGMVFEVSLKTGDEHIAAGSQVIIYQEDEIYVAFKTDTYGEYLFNLPIGHAYEVVFGGEEYVNKRVMIDAKQCTKPRNGHDLQLNMGLFKPVKGADLTVFESPVARFEYQIEKHDILPDMSFISKGQKEINKAIKKMSKIDLSSSSD
jgi:hypothetical protein